MKPASAIICLLSCAIGQSAFGASFHYYDLPESLGSVRATPDGSIQLLNFRPSSGGIATWKPGEALNVVDLGAGISGAIATDISVDGSVIVGQFSRPKQDGATEYRYFAWKQGRGVIELGESNQNNFGFPVENNSSPWVSDDGETVTFATEMFDLWGQLARINWVTRSVQMLGEFPNVLLSKDGHVVAGTNSAAFDITYRVDAGPEIGIDLPSSHDFDLNAWRVRGLSHDGKVFGGLGQDSQGVMEGFMVGLDGQPHLLGLTSLGMTSPGATFAMNADASAIVGSGIQTTRGPAVQYYWTPLGGAKNLQSLLIERGAGQGLPPAEYLWHVTDVSDNGVLVSGSIVRPDQSSPHRMPFLAYLGVGQTLGDTDNDGDVDLSDLNIVRNNFGGTGLGDTEGNGTVDLADLNNVRKHFGESVPAMNSVPEPASWALVLTGLIALIAAHYRNRS